MINPFMPRAMPAPLVAKATLLLAEFCPVDGPILRARLHPESPAPLIKAAIVVKQALSEPGWFHGGLND